MGEIPIETTKCTKYKKEFFSSFVFFAGNSWNNTQGSCDDDWENDLNETNYNNGNSHRQKDDDDDGWHDTPFRGTWINSERSAGRLSFIAPNV